jgi:hypothetical protein
MVRSAGMNGRIDFRFIIRATEQEKGPVTALAHTVWVSVRGRACKGNLGELAHGTNRIVRIGTHTGNDQLRSRLKQHFLIENKDRSIFRKNIGRALLNKDHDPFLGQWELDLTSRQAKLQHIHVDINRQKQIEKRFLTISNPTSASLFCGSTTSSSGFGWNLG